MPRTLATIVLLTLAASVPAADPGYTVKVEDAAAPKELTETVRLALAPKAMSVFDEKGKLLCTVWAVKGLDSKATADQAKAGLKYGNVEETTIVGAVKFPEVWTDYRKQKIKPGVYTLRLAIQPMDGDHMGTAPYNEFCLLCPADLDTRAGAMELEAMYKLSTKSTIRKHPAMMLLFPNRKPADAPVVEAKPKEHYVLSFPVTVSAGGQKVPLGFSLVVVGATMAE